LVGHSQGEQNFSKKILKRFGCFENFAHQMLLYY
jgi:hypothetical protein